MEKNLFLKMKMTIGRDDAVGRLVTYYGIDEIKIEFMRDDDRSKI